MEANQQRMLHIAIGFMVLAVMFALFTFDGLRKEDDKTQYQQTIELIEKTNQGRTPKY